MHLKTCFYLGALRAALFCTAKLVPRLPKGPLEWGDVNIIHTSDSHGWFLGHTKNRWPEPNYSATLGDFASFVGHMKRIAEEKDVDLLLVDSGDLHDGSGLTDGYPMPGVNGHEAIKSFLKIPYDIMTIGNHELFHADVSIDVYRNFAPKLSDGRYLSSNAFILRPGENGIAIAKVIGSQYRRFKTMRGRQVTSLGVIFDFKEHCPNITIQHPADMVAEKWFQDLIRQPTDIFVLSGHMSVMSAVTGNWEIVVEEIRKYHPNIPIAILGGHTHLRFCRQLDSNSMALESGRFMETVGWMSLTMGGPNNSTSFSRKYLDTNKRAYMFHTNTTEKTFDSANGLEIDAFLRSLYSQWDLGKIHGCSSQDYFVNRFPWPHPQNIQYFYTHKVIPEILIRGWNRADRPYVYIGNRGMVRFDIYRGAFTRNDQLTALPFKEGYSYIVVSWLIAQEVKNQLLEDFPGRLDAKSILVKESGSTGKPTVQRPFSLPPSDLTPGYVTDDKCHGEGDDTEHLRIPYGHTPKYYGNDPDYQLPDDHLVDVIIPTFLKEVTVVAINKLSPSRLFTVDDFHDYGTITSRKIFAKYFEQFPC